MTERPQLVVFLLKPNRSQTQDLVDMITLWPLVAVDFPAARRRAHEARYRGPEVRR